MDYVQVQADMIPIALLLEADPSEENIHSYLHHSMCFVAKDTHQVVAASIVQRKSDALAEILNVSVLASHQRQGIGSQLLQFSLSQLKAKGVFRVELGTGAFGYPLIYYQRLGFRVDAVIKDYFLEHYSEPIYEYGIRHKDMLRLSIDL
ncbi:putative N-acetyltransferase YvbK [Marinomonas spartinae]|uniref:Putative N-acetyltransferase YvbK n=1 Tax=Marinomonas spartinae TaxID=1792290 RepID=A0A1A8TJB7_9GAMM|nr:GNAT family N-acetyltransferase [Marinomonas spartinae]SBS32610.1 putative N-acetyltransferase YvbK [Marinomonas spartinae]